MSIALSEEMSKGEIHFLRIGTKHTYQHVFRPLFQAFTLQILKILVYRLRLLD